MKALKGSLVALVAILAVGLTVAMQAGAFEPTRVNECYFSAVLLDPAVDCEDVIVNDQVTSCTTPIASLPIFSLSGTFTTSPETVCSTGSKFCCLKIVTNTRLCDQPQINPEGDPIAGYYRVGQVFCKP